MQTSNWLTSQYRRRKANRPICLSVRSSKQFVTFVVSLAGATDVFLYGLVVPVTPMALVSRLGVSPGESKHEIRCFLLCLALIFLLRHRSGAFLPTNASRAGGRISQPLFALDWPRCCCARATTSLTGPWDGFSKVLPQLWSGWWATRSSPILSVQTASGRR